MSLASQYGVQEWKIAERELQVTVIVRVSPFEYDLGKQQKETTRHGEFRESLIDVVFGNNKKKLQVVVLTDVA